MTQKQDLELLRATRPRQQPHQREQIPHHQINERPEHAAPPSTDGKSPEPSQPDAHRGPGTSLRTLRPEREIEEGEDHAGDPPSARPEAVRHEYWRPSLRTHASRHLTARRRQRTSGGETGRSEREQSRDPDHLPRLTPRA